MKWRDVLIGAVSTLIVTIVSGIVIHYATREAPKEDPKERLFFDVDAPFAFESDQRQLSLTRIRVVNSGDKTAENVVIGIDFDESVKVADNVVSLSSGSAGSYEVKGINDNIIQVSLPRLTPNEYVYITVLVDASDHDSPKVAAKSDDSTAVKRPEAPQVSNPSDDSPPIRSLLLMIPVALVTQLFLFRSLQKLNRRRRSWFSRDAADFNNTGFVYIHTGLLEDGIEILRRSIDERGGEPHTLANYGLALGLAGDRERAKVLLDAAEFWDNHDHPHLQAIVAFNRAILAIGKDLEGDGISLLKHAIDLDGEEILRYCKFSSVVKDLTIENEELRQFLEEHQQKKT